MVSFSEIGHFFCIFTFYDCIEIIIMSWLSYKIIHFLTTHSEYNLLKPTIIYVSVIAIAHFIHLVTLELFVLITAPAVICFFILIHQEQLQKNFVALHRLPTQKTHKKMWHYSLIQWCQKQASKGISSSYIIEQTENLESVLTSYVPCHTLFSSSLLEIIYESPLFFSEKPILIQYDGIIKGLNINYTKHPILHTYENQQAQELFISAKTDALIMHMNAHTLTFTCVHNNQILNNLSAHMMTLILDKFFEVSTSSLQGKTYEHLFTQKKHTNIGS